MPAQRPPMTTTTLRLPPGDLARATTLARREGRTRSNLLTMLVQAGLAALERAGAAKPPSGHGGQA